MVVVEMMIGDHPRLHHFENGIADGGDRWSEEFVVWVIGVDADFGRRLTRDSRIRGRAAGLTYRTQPAESRGRLRASTMHFQTKMWIPSDCIRLRDVAGFPDSAAILAVHSDTCLPSIDAYAMGDAIVDSVRIPRCENIRLLSIRTSVKGRLYWFPNMKDSPPYEKESERVR